MRRSLLALAELPRGFWVTLVFVLFAGCSATATDLSALGANLPGLVAALVAIIQVYKEKSKVAQMIAAAELAQEAIQREQEKAVLTALDMRNAEVTELRLLVENAVAREHQCVEQLIAMQIDFKKLREEKL
jgi:uncharacterized cupredoxin-like copper-binding protein